MLHRSIFLTVAFEPLDSTEKMQNKKAPALQVLSIGADDGARTRYLHLGKVALYQMSYIRIYNGGNNRARTCDPLLVRQMLSQLSYAPTFL